MRRLPGALNIVLSGAIGLLAFVYPFLYPSVADAAQRQIAPLLTAALVGLSVVAVLVEAQGRNLGAKTVALLGVLVAFTSVLRFIEEAVPLPGGFSPVFAPIIIVGYVFGGRVGFLMGTMTLVVSALMTGAVGPWLPYQMFSAGWAGLTAGWLPRTGKRVDVVVLCVFGFFWGLLYGVVMNLYFWPFSQGPADTSWAQGMGLRAAFSAYAAFYAVTSLGWDLIRAFGNLSLLAFLTGPMSRVLLRFQRRFHFEVQGG